ncbi:40S ribosomal protein S26-A [Durusdinium trenchii]|uniref:40S ribosomal protein S26 n=1 Tax=Durusdinium trenchii TaxID=1381693 RepID=A0ABP0QNE1_9DINO
MPKASTKANSLHPNRRCRHHHSWHLVRWHIGWRHHPSTAKNSAHSEDLPRHATVPPATPPSRSRSPRLDPATRRPPRHGRGHTAIVRCSNCCRCVPKDKAIKRFQVRNMVDASSQRDLREASVYQTFMLFDSIETAKQKKDVSQIRHPAKRVSCAIHGRVVRVRNKVLRASPEGASQRASELVTLRCLLLGMP